jgi:hypothetical protein
MGEAVEAGASTRGFGGSAAGEVGIGVRLLVGVTAGAAERAQLDKTEKNRTIISQVQARKEFLVCIFLSKFPQYNTGSRLSSGSKSP